MSSEKQLEGELNMETVINCVKHLEDYLNKGLKSGTFVMKDVHEMYECFVVVVKTVEQCDTLQKKMRHLLRQQELIRQAENSQPIAPK
jgi:hypothetical protein